MHSMAITKTGTKSSPKPKKSKSPMVIHVDTDTINRTQTVHMDYDIFSLFRQWIEAAARQANEEIMFEFEILMPEKDEGVNNRS